MEFVEDLLAEAMCRKIGLDPELVTVSAAKIDVERSRGNKARPVALYPDVVERYVEAMKAGDVFPAIVLAKMAGLDKYVIVGGNHRHAAAIKRGCKAFSAYIVECNEDEFDLLGKALGTIGPKTEDRATNIAQAVSLVQGRGLEIGLVCRSLHVPRAAVEAAIKSSRIKVVAAKMGYAIPDSVATTAIIELNQHLKSEPLFKAVAEFFVKTRPSAAEAKGLNASIAACKSEAAKIQMVMDMTADAVPTSGKATRRTVDRPIRANLIRLLAALEGTVKGRTFRYNLQIDKPEVKEHLLRWKTAIAQLETILTNG